MKFPVSKLLEQQNQGRFSENHNLRSGPFGAAAGARIQKSRKITRLSRHGFSMTELLVILGAVGLIAVIAVPSFIEMRRRSQLGSCSENIRTIEAAADQYLAHSGSDSSTTGVLTMQPLIDQQFLKSNPECPTGTGYNVSIENENVRIEHAHRRQNETEATGPTK